VIRPAAYINVQAGINIRLLKDLVGDDRADREKDERANSL
jgi:hypothetical protein